MIVSGIISTNNLYTNPRNVEASGGMTNTQWRRINMNILAQNQSGIYEIFNTVNGHRYIGSAVYIGRRWKCHLQQLRTNKHHSQYLQRAFNLYGEFAFVFRIIEECNIVDLINIEQRYLNELKPEYNISKTAGSPLGVKHSDETKAKVSAAGKGNKYNLGKVHTKEHNEKISKSLMGRVSPTLGRVQTDEEKKRRSIANIGKHLGSKPWLGKSHTEETKEKMRLAQKGKPKSEEHKQKLREARRRFLDSLKGLFVE